MSLKKVVIAFIGCALMGIVTGCTPSEPNELDKLGTIDITIKGQSFKLWVADDSGEAARGLMFITAEQMARMPDGTERGMIFVFDYEQERSFWMRNTIIPLDIAYITTAGRVVSTYTMAPLDDRAGQYPSGEPHRFAIEVNAGVWAKVGLKAGDRIEIPDSLLNRTP